MIRQLLIVACAILPIACGAAEEAKYRYKEHYSPARKAISDPTVGQPDVIEIFWYGCPHCFHFDPAVTKWEANKADDVNFQRIPASLGRPIGVLHSRAFYTADALGILDKMHPILFAAIHEQHKQLNNEAAIEAVFTDAGILPEVFRETFNSFAVEGKVQQAESIIQSLGITSVPTMSVDLKYWTGAREAGGFDGMLNVVDFLVEQSRDQSKNKAN
jgi:thiol:disulfide interchange protein DsbA